MGEAPGIGDSLQCNTVPAWALLKMYVAEEESDV